MRYRFEVTLTPQNGKSITSNTVFEIAAKAEMQDGDSPQDTGNTDNIGLEITQACSMAQESHLAAQETLQTTALQITAIHEEFSDPAYADRRALETKIKTLKDEYRVLKRPFYAENHHVIQNKKTGKIDRALLSRFNKRKARIEAIKKKTKALKATLKSDFNLWAQFYNPRKKLGCQEFSNHLLQTFIGQNYHYDYETAMALCEQQDAAQQDLNVAEQDTQTACGNP